MVVGWSRTCRRWLEPSLCLCLTSPGLVLVFPLEQDLLVLRLRSFPFPCTLGSGILQLLQSRTSRKFLACRLTPDMETKLLFMTSRVSEPTEEEKLRCWLGCCLRSAGLLPLSPDRGWGRSVGAPDEPGSCSELGMQCWKERDSFQSKAVIKPMVVYK